MSKKDPGHISAREAYSIEDYEPCEVKKRRWKKGGGVQGDVKFVDIERKPTRGKRLKRKVIRVPSKGDVASEKLKEIRKLGRNFRIVSQKAVKNSDRSCTWHIVYED